MLHTSLAQQLPEDTEQMESARRRAKAAAAAGHKLAGGVINFDDPQTHRYSFDEITTGRSEGVNPLCKELYLDNSEFMEIFGLTKKEFYSLRLWKQRELKRMVGLF